MTSSRLLMTFMSHEMKIDEKDILVSCDVSSLFRTIIPVDETIEILAERAFKDDWLNKEYNLNITKTNLICYEKPTFSVGRKFV